MARLDGAAVAARVASGELVTLPGRVVPWLGLLLAAAAFSAVGVAMMWGPLSSLPFGSSRWDSPFTVLVGAVSVLFFGVLGGGAALHGLRHRRRALVLEPRGLRFQGSALVPWSAVRRTVQVAQPRNRKVQLLVALSPTGMEAWRTGVAPGARWLHRFNRGTVSLPDVRDLRLDELGLAVELLRRGA